jgi:cytochrome c oxidase assembly protein subunit 15
MGRLLLVAAGLVIFLGTVVTSTGPHGGDPKARRLDFSLHDVARLHSLAVWLFLALTVVTLWTMQRVGAPAEVMRRGEVVLLVLLLQGGVGYLQYFSGVPSWLVAIHVALAATLWAVTVQFVLGLTTRSPTALAAPAGLDHRLAPTPTPTPTPAQA